MQSIRLALSDYFNQRGGPVWGLRSDGTWHQLGKARIYMGMPEGYSHGLGSWFVLSAAEVRDV